MPSAANTYLRVTELSYDALRDNLKDFLRGKPELQDYNFEGSTMSILLDLLAYNTYYNSFYANMVGNEMFIDSAALRTSVVSRAKHLGYVPRTAKSAVAKVTLALAPLDDEAPFVTIPAQTKFDASLDGVNYTFSTSQEVSVFPDSNNIFQTELTLYEGVWTTERHTVSDNPGPEEKYKILNDNIDLSSLTVQVQESLTSTAISNYTRVSNILDVNDESKVFYFEENLDGNYEIHFGDGVLGRKLSPGNIVIVTYRVCSGSVANFITSFTKEGQMFDILAYSFATTQIAQGGQDREEIESIRFNAPLSYDMQNRVVTQNDYKQYILSQNPDIQSLAVWGGEDNDPPFWGKVFVVAKPFNGFGLTELRKTAIANALDKLNMQSLEVVMQDPSFVYILPTINVFYDTASTTVTPDALREFVADTVVNFETNFLAQLDQPFKYSRLVRDIDNSHFSIVSNETGIRFQKRFSPILNDVFTYTFPFYTEVFHPYDGYAGSLDSSEFTLPLFSQQLKLDTDGNGAVRAYYLDNDKKIIVKDDVGTIEYDTGKVTLINFNPSTVDGDEMRINITPTRPNLIPKLNQILLIAETRIDVYDNASGELLSTGTADTQGQTETLFETAIKPTATL